MTTTRPKKSLKEAESAIFDNLDLDELFPQEPIAPPAGFEAQTAEPGSSADSAAYGTAPVPVLGKYETLYKVYQLHQTKPGLERVNEVLRIATRSLKQFGPANHAWCGEEDVAQQVRNLVPGLTVFVDARLYANQIWFGYPDTGMRLVPKFIADELEESLLGEGVKRERKKQVKAKPKLEELPGYAELAAEVEAVIAATPESSSDEPPF